MTQKIPANYIADASASDVTNNSNATGSMLSNALDNIYDDITNLNGIDYLSTNNPATNTNPSKTNAIWVNSSTGIVFVCIDNTTNNNVWYGYSAWVPYIGYRFYGINKGFVAGGANSLGTTVQTIDIYSLISNVSSLSPGSLTAIKSQAASSKSMSDGFAAGGGNPNPVATIDKFSFVGESSAGIGSLTVTRYRPSGQSSSVSGYSSGGQNATPTYYNVIDKYSFASVSGATDVGDLAATRTVTAGQSSSTSGFVTGGSNTGAPVVNIYQFSFASDGNAPNVGSLSQARNWCTGVSSTTHGYTAGGSNQTATLFYNVIDSFNFASPAIASNIGNLSTGYRMAAGFCSQTHGFIASGSTSVLLNYIDRFSFASNGNATDVGDLTLSRNNACGFQQ